MWAMNVDVEHKRGKNKMLLITSAPDETVDPISFDFLTVNNNIRLPMNVHFRKS